MYPPREKTKRGVFITPQSQKKRKRSTDPILNSVQKDEIKKDDEKIKKYKCHNPVSFLFTIASEMDPELDTGQESLNRV